MVLTDRQTDDIEDLANGGVLIERNGRFFIDIGAGEPREVLKADFLLYRTENLLERSEEPDTYVLTSEGEDLAEGLGLVDDAAEDGWDVIGEQYPSLREWIERDGLLCVHAEMAGPEGVHEVVMMVPYSVDEVDRLASWRAVSEQVAEHDPSFQHIVFGIPVFAVYLEDWDAMTEFMGVDAGEGLVVHLAPEYARDVYDIEDPLPLLRPQATVGDEVMGIEGYCPFDGGGIAANYQPADRFMRLRSIGGAGARGNAVQA